MMRLRSFVFTMLALGVCVAAVPRVHAQAEYTAIGPGSYLAIGVTASAFQQDYGQRIVGGGTAFVDANLYRRVGMEAEARQLTVHTDEDVRESTYLVGPKISAFSRNMRPYAKLLAGRGELRFPFDYAHGSYFVVAPGAGLDWRVGQSRLLVRVVDFEYQIWPQFTFGAMHPYGVSTGLSWQVFSGSGRIRGRVW